MHQYPNYPSNAKLSTISMLAALANCKFHHHQVKLIVVLHHRHPILACVHPHHPHLHQLHQLHQKSGIYIPSTTVIPKMISLCGVCLLYLWRTSLSHSAIITVRKRRATASSMASSMSSIVINNLESEDDEDDNICAAGMGSRFYQRVRLIIDPILLQY
jgi:hypothetical protein